MDAPTEPARVVQARGDEHEDGPGRRALALAPFAVPDDVAVTAASIVDAALSEPASSEPALTAPQRAILDFERQWWRRGGAKEQAIRDTFGMTPTRYYQALNGVLDLPAAMRYDAALVHRLLRLRADATRSRRLLD